MKYAASAGVLLTVLLAGGWWWYSGNTPSAESEAEQDQPPVRREQADPGRSATQDPVESSPPRQDPQRDEARSRNGQALALLEQGDARAAELLFVEACALAPEEPVFRANLSRARVRIGRSAWEAGLSAEALAWFERAAEADPDGGSPLEWKASVQLRSGDRDGAAATVRAALVQHPRSAGLLRLRAELAFLRGDVAAAAEDARAALAIEDTPVARERLRQLEEEERAYRSFLTDATAHFDSRYDPQDATLTARMPELHAQLEEAWTDVVALLGVQPEQRLLVLWLSPARWSGAAPSWSAGLYDGRVRLLVRTDDVGGAGLRATMRHELTHALLHALGARLPTWLHEGLAQRGEGRDVERARRSLRTRERRLDAAALDGDWTAWSDAALLDEAYATALSLVAYLEEHAGVNAIPSLLLAAPSAGLAAAWARVFVRPFKEWEQEHARWIDAMRD